MQPTFRQEAHPVPEPKETDKQQQQETLSLRISRELRKRLDKMREVTARVTGEYVSTSEVAKQILESAPGHQLQDRIAVAELLNEPTESLVTIRRKCEAHQTLSRAEWTVLAHYVQQGDEAQFSNPISTESSIAILEAFLAVHQLRESSSNRETYFLGNLMSPDRGQDREYTAENVRRAVVHTIQYCRDPVSRQHLPMIARNLSVVLDEDASPVDRLNHALYPYWKSLWLVAARGHYSERRKPIRETRDRSHDFVYDPVIPPVSEGDYSLTFARDGNDFDMLLRFPESRGALYAFGGYPRIREFRRLLETFNPQATPKRAWSRDHYFAYVMEHEQQQLEVWFRAQGQGATLRFTLEEWSTVQRLFQRAWEMPELRNTWEILAMEYGEL